MEPPNSPCKIGKFPVINGVSNPFCVKCHKGPETHELTVYWDFINDKDPIELDNSYEDKLARLMTATTITPKKPRGRPRKDIPEVYKIPENKTRSLLTLEELREREKERAKKYYYQHRDEILLKKKAEREAILNATKPPS